MTRTCLSVFETDKFYFDEEYMHNFLNVYHLQKNADDPKMKRHECLFFPTSLNF